MTAIEPHTIHGACTLVYIVTSVVGAAFCWGHMCRPFDRHPRQFYPARRVASIAMPFAMLLIPYALIPDSADIWLWTRVYTGFGIPLLWLAVYIAFLPFLRITRHYDLDHYSNEDQFRLNFYKKLLWTIAVYNLAAVLGAAIGDYWLMDVMMLVMAVTTVLIMLQALHPYGFPESERIDVDKIAEDLKAKADSIIPQEAPTNYKQSTIRSALPLGSAKNYERLDASIREKELFLDPNVTLDDVARQLDVSTTEIKAMLQQRDITFYYYINNMRMEKRLREWEANKGYADKDVTIDTLALQLQSNAHFLKNYFSHVHETNFTHWLATIRIAHAKQILIEQPDLTVSKVADAVGYDTYSGLSRKFTEFEGISPSQWREQQLA